MLSLGAGSLPGDLSTLGPVQLVPQGLMGLLQLKHTGLLPGWLAQSIQPILELRDWYFQSRRQDEFSIFGSAPTTGLVSNIGVKPFQLVVGFAQVPQNQLWYVEQLVATGTSTAAADVFTFAATISNSQTSNFEQLGAPWVDPGGARIKTGLAKADRGFWAQPSDIFSVASLDISSAGGINFALHLRATILPI